MEYEKIRIACDNMSSTTTYGEFEKLVVFCVAARNDTDVGVHPFRLAR